MSVFSPHQIYSQTEQGWELKKDVDGIKVYFRESAEGPIKELRISFDVEASLSTMVAVLKDIDAFPEWIYKCSEARVIEKKSDQEVYYYSVVDFPWPLTDRDAISYSKFYQDPKTKVIHTYNTAEPGLEPERRHKIRVKTMDIQWTIKPLSPHKAHVDYYMLSDPGGNIPSWLINFALDRGPVQSMKAYREMVKKPKYQHARLVAVQDFSMSNDQ